MDRGVLRSSRGLVRPARPTPTGMLDLSVIDRLPVLRCNARTLHVFRNGPSGDGRAAQVIREALAKALVSYYPLAGRLKLSNHGHLQISCSAEGVWLVEAFANWSLDAANYFRDLHQLSIPCDELLPDHPPQAQALEPLVLVQVTQFSCDGFVIGLTFCHSICDGLGAAQFLHAVGELARGLDHLTVSPVWHRDFHRLPSLPFPPQEDAEAATMTVAEAGNNNELVPDPMNATPPSPPTLPNYQLEYANIDVVWDQINQLKQEFQSTTGHTCSAFEIVAATLWKYRTQSVAVNLEKDTQVNLVFFANCRQILEPPLPQGFYGNCFFPVTITTSIETILGASNSDVVKMIQEAKANLPTEFAKWMKMRMKAGEQKQEEEEDPFAPPLLYTTLFISEWGRLGFNQVDYGWGPPVYVIPIQGSTIIPVGIVASLPWPNKGIRLMTWCVHKPHLHPFLHLMAQALPNNC
ncbi:Taxadien-5-alpha-ol O-acetyltransferase [Bertholletia excelsa]